nr:hypothetical protein [Tanacetum cinerariifolium]
TTNLPNEISNFQQRFDESFYEVWDRYKDLLRACPDHGFTELHQLDAFYNALNPADQDSLNSATGDNLLERRTQDVLIIIENKSKVRNSRNKSVVSQVKSSDVNSSSSKIAKLTHAVNQQTSAVTTAMTAILKQLQATPPLASVKPVQEICVTCGGAHPYYQCLAANGNTFLELQDNIQGYVAAAVVNYNQEEDERVEETLTDQDLAEYTIKVPPLLVQKHKPHSQRNFVLHQRDPLHPNIPYPSRILKQKQQEKNEKTLKALFSNKEKLLELANTSLNENCSAVILKKLPKKLGDPGKFLIPCGFSELKCKALANLGASINLMPLFVWKKLDLPELISTRMTLELANRAICTPAEIARDVFVPVGKFTFPTDFVIIDYESDPRVPLILGRPFLQTAHALIDVHRKEMILRDGDERLALNMRHDTSSYSNQPQKESINMINIFNDLSGDFIENLFSTNHHSVNLTFSSHPELTSPEVKDDIFDPEGGNVLPEKLQDLDSTKDLHPPHHVNPLSDSTTSYSSPNHLLEEFVDELALITFPPGNDDLPFDIESDLKEIKYLLHHDPIKDMDSILEDSVDEDNLVDFNDDLVDTMPEMFTDKHAFDYSSLTLYDEYNDDLFKVESDTEYVYDDPFDSREEKIKESKLLIDELDLLSDFLPSSEYDSFLFEDFSEVDALPSTNNEDKGESKAITTRSGIVLDGPSVPIPYSFINPEEDERVEETLTDHDLTEYTIKGQPVVSSKKNPRVLFSPGRILFLNSSMNPFPSRTTNLRNEISNFQQRFDESFHEAWDRYKDLLRACPHHGFTELHQLDTFYNALNPADQNSLNSAAGGNLLERRTQDVLTIIENKSKVRNSRNKLIVSQVKSSDVNSSSSSEIAKLTHAVNQQTSVVTTAMTAILKQFQATPPPASGKDVEEICVTCGGAHPYYHRLAADGNTFLEIQDNIQGYISAAAVNYNQGNSSYRPPGVANQIRPPGFSQPNVQNNQNQFSQPQGYNRGNNFNQDSSYQAPMQQNQVVPLSELEKIKKMNAINMKAMQTQINNVKNKLRNEMKTSIQASMSNQTNELKNMMASFFQINTASTSDSGPLPSNTIANPKGEMKAITTRSGIVLDGPSVPKPPPFINLKEDERVEETLTDPELDALILILKYQKMLKALLSNKKKLLEMANTPFNENYSAVILKKLPKKLGDPGKFLIPCGFGELKCKALADLGASINLMALSVWKKLGLPELISIRMTLKLANRAIYTPAGIARDVFVSVGKFTFLANFVIVYYESVPRVLLILGRPFLRTARALINVYGEEMILRDGDERLTLNMRHDTSSYSNQPQKESINMINIYDDSCEDFLEDLFATNRLSGNPTFSSHPNLTLPKVKDDIFDPEGDMVLIEKLINLDSTKDLPPPHNINPLSGSTTSSSPNHLLEEFADELALTTFPPGNDDIPFDIKSDLKEIEYLLNHDPIKEMDSIDEDNLADLNDNLVDTIPEMFTDERALDYSSPLLYDEYDDDIFELESDIVYAYNDPFESKREKIKDFKLLIDELDPLRSSDFLPSPEYDSFLFEDFFEVDALPSTNNEDKVFNLGIFIQENLSEVTVQAIPDKNVKKLAISHASLILKDFDPPLSLYELLFHKEVPRSETLLSFSFENEEKVFKLGILTSKEVHTSLLLELSYWGPKAFKVIKILVSPMEIFPCSFGEGIRILDVPWGFVNKSVLDPNKTPDSSQRPPHNCPKCGNPIDGLYCRQCALSRKKLKEFWFTICESKEIFKDFLNTSESSNDNTNVVNAPQVPFILNQDPGEDSSQSPAHIDHHCCYRCGDSLDAWLQQQEQVVNLDSYTSEPSQCQKIPIYYDDDDDEEIPTPLRDIIIFKLPLCIAITPVLSTEEPVDSLIIEDEHLDTIPATESDEVIKSSVEDLIPIPSKSEGILDNMCDVPFRDNSPPLDISKDQFEDFSDSNDDSTSIDDEYFSIDDIDYVEASPPDSELVSLEDVKDFDPEDGEIDTHIILTIKDDILREKLLNINLLIAKIKELKNNPTPSTDSVLKSPSSFPNSFLEETDTSDNSLPESKIFCFDMEEKRSGNPTSHSDLSLLNYKAFYCDKKDFNPGSISSNDATFPLFAYIVWIFLPFLMYPVAPPYLLSSRNEDTISDAVILIYHSFMPGVSHRSGTFMKFNVYPNHLNESPMEILSSTCFPMDQ